MLVVPIKKITKSSQCQPFYSDTDACLALFTGLDD